MVCLTRDICIKITIEEKKAKIKRLMNICILFAYIFYRKKAYVIHVYSHPNFVSIIVTCQQIRLQ